MVTAAAYLTAAAVLLDLATSRWPLAYRAGWVCVAGVAACLLADLFA